MVAFYGYGELKSKRPFRETKSWRRRIHGASTRSRTNEVAKPDSRDKWLGTQFRQPRRSNLYADRHGGVELDDGREDSINSGRRRSWGLPETPPRSLKY